MNKYQDKLVSGFVFSFKTHISYSDFFQVNLIFPEEKIITGSISINFSEEKRKIGSKYLYPNVGLLKEKVRNRLDKYDVHYTQNQFGVYVINGLGPFTKLSVLNHYKSIMGSEIKRFKVANHTHRYTKSNAQHLKNVGFNSSSLLHRLGCTFNLIKGEDFESYYGKLAQYIDDQRKKEKFQEFSVKVIEQGKVN